MVVNLPLYIENRNLSIINNDNTTKNTVYNINYGNQDEKSVIFNYDENRDRGFINDKSYKYDDNYTKNNNSEGIDCLLRVGKASA